ncbi:MAG: type II toxin-antitoxin system RelE family toxin [Acetobacteraceae bacterium]
MTWHVAIAAAAEAELASLDPQIRTRITKRLDLLAGDPLRAANVKALGGGLFRLRVGDWRIIYTLTAAELLILVIRVAHRREAYR